MPWILWRHIFFELLKVLVLTAAVIVVVVAFGAVIKPIAQGVLGPIGIVKYTALAIIPMLQFSLPFAAGFAATIVLHRMASDNEIQAMSVSGMSYRQVFVPVMGLGVVLSALMLVLVQTVIPTFLGKMERVITDDAANVVVSALRNGDSFVAGNLLIHADGAAMAPGPPPSGAQQRIILNGVAAIELEGQVPRTEFVAKQAVVDLHDAEDGLIMKMAMHDATVIRPHDGTFIRVPEARPEAVRMPRKTDAGPNTMRWSTLEAEIRQPESSWKAREARRPLDDALLKSAAWDAMAASLSSGSLKLGDIATQRVYEVSGARLSGQQFVPSQSGGSIQVVERDGDLVLREATARSIAISSVTPALAESGQRIIRLAIAPVAGSSASGATAVTARTRLPALVQGLTPLVEYSQPDTAGLIGPNDPSSSPPSAAAEGGQHAPLISEWRKAVSNVYWEDISHRWQRLGQVVAVFLTLVLGGVLGVWRRSSQPLAVYLIAFIPAVLDLILISSGQQHIRAAEFGFGMTVLWSGNLVMLLVISGSWWALARR